MDKFKVIFLTEAREFLLELDEKSRDKIIFNIDKSKMIMNYSKSWKEKFGSLELYIIKLTLEFLHFGTKQRKLKL
jgi:hypothetical protein